MGVTVILCSATQPCFERLNHQLNAFGDLITNDKYDEYKQIFKRTVIIDKGTFKLEEVSSLSEEILKKANSLLIVCNTKREAADLYLILRIHVLLPV